MGELWTPAIALVAGPVALCVPRDDRGTPAPLVEHSGCPETLRYQFKALGTRAKHFRRRQGALKSLILNISYLHLLSGRTL